MIRILFHIANVALKLNENYFSIKFLIKKLNN